MSTVRRRKQRKFGPTIYLFVVFIWSQSYQTFFLRKTYIFSVFLLLSLVILCTCIIFVCYKHSSFTTKSENKENRSLVGLTHALITIFLNCKTRILPPTKKKSQNKNKWLNYSSFFSLFRPVFSSSIFQNFEFCQRGK